jgi:membrane protease subunit (stomatin/prohibitin family)
MKKLIYQVPFLEVQRMPELMNILHTQFNDVAYIDVELNSLEDAYLNIAKEEEKLLENLNKYGLRTKS